MYYAARFSLYRGFCLHTPVRGPNQTVNRTKVLKLILKSNIKKLERKNSLFKKYKIIIIERRGRRIFNF